MKPVVPPFCTVCEGTGELAHVVRPNFQESIYDGRPWNRQADESDDARYDVIRPDTCPHCQGTGHEPEETK